MSNKLSCFVRKLNLRFDLLKKRGVFFFRLKTWGSPSLRRMCQQRCMWVCVIGIHLLKKLLKKYVISFLWSSGVFLIDFPDATCISDYMNHADIISPKQSYSLLILHASSGIDGLRILLSCVIMTNIDKKTDDTVAYITHRFLFPYFYIQKIYIIVKAY